MSAETNIGKGPQDRTNPTRALGLSPEMRGSLERRGFKILTLPEIDWGTRGLLNLDDPDAFRHRPGSDGNYINRIIPLTVWSHVRDSCLPFPDSLGYQIALGEFPDHLFNLPHNDQVVTKKTNVGEIEPIIQHIGERMGLSPDLELDLPTIFEAKILEGMGYGPKITHTASQDGELHPELTSSVVVSPGIKRWDPRESTPPIRQAQLVSLPSDPGVSSIDLDAPLGSTFFRLLVRPRGIART